MYYKIKYIMYFMLVVPLTVSISCLYKSYDVCTLCYIFCMGNCIQKYRAATLQNMLSNNNTPFCMQYGQ